MKLKRMDTPPFCLEPGGIPLSVKLKGEIIMEYTIMTVHHVKVN